MTRIAIKNEYHDNYHACSSHIFMIFLKVSQVPRGYPWLNPHHPAPNIACHEGLHRSTRTWRHGWSSSKRISKKWEERWLNAIKTTCYSRMILIVYPLSVLGCAIISGFCKIERCFIGPIGIINQKHGNTRRIKSANYLNSSSYGRKT